MATDGTRQVNELSLRDRVMFETETDGLVTGMVTELALLGDSMTSACITIRLDNGTELVFDRIMSDRVTMVWA